MPPERATGCLGPPVAIALAAMATSVAIVGVSGLSGIELARLVDARPELELVAVLSDRWAGDRLGKWVRDLPSRSELVVQPMSELSSVPDEAEIVALATPAEASAELAPRGSRARKATPRRSSRA